VVAYGGTAAGGGGSGSVGPGTTNYIPAFTSQTTIGNSIVYQNGSNIDVSLLSTPTSPAAALATGGALTVGTAYHYVVTAVAPGGGETLQSTEVTATPTTGNQTITVSWAAVTGAISYKVYRTATSGSYGATSLAANPTTSSFSDTGVALTAGAPPAAITASSARISSSGTSWFNGGAVGIQTTSPANVLDIGTGGGIHITSGVPTSIAMALYNNSGTLYWNGAPLAGSTISGTTNYIPVFTSASAIGNSVIYQSGSNIGIGTTTPAYGFHQASPTYPTTFPSVNFHSAGPICSFEASNSTELAVGYQNIAPFPMWLQARGSGNAATPIILNPSGGNIGIGTTPNRLLEVGAGIPSSVPSSVSLAALNFVGAANTSGQAVVLNAIAINFPNAGEIYSYNYGTSAFIPLHINATQIIMGDSGRGNAQVGIGPAGVMLNLRLTVSDTTPVACRLYGSYGSATLNDTQLRFFGAASALDLWILGTDVVTANGSQDFHFYNNGGTANNVTMTLTRGGNVGIGTTNATQKLTVVGAAQISDNTGANGGQTLTSVNTTTTGTNYGAVLEATGSGATSNTGLYVYAQGATNNFSLRIPAPASGAGWAIYSDATASSFFNGNVGIGIAPSYPLHCYQAPICQVTIQGTTNFAQVRLVTDNRGWQMSSGGSGSGVYNGAYYLFDETAGAARFVILPSGYVGIGTTSPLNTLSVINPTNQTTVAGANQITVGESTNNSAYRLNLGYFNDGQWKAAIQTLNNGPVGSTLLLQPSGGNVGIGLMVPFTTLHVNGPLHITGSPSPSMTSPSSCSFDFYSGNARWISMGPDTATNGGWQFISVRSDNSNALYQFVILPSGFVGIGTSNPASLLTVFGASPQILIGDGMGDNYSIGRDVTSGILYIKGTQTSYTGYAFFVNSTTQVLTITNGGNVGINDASPSCKLACGTTLAPIKIASWDGTTACYGIGVASGQLTFGASIDPNTGTPQMVLTSSGNVGIGTTTPLNTLSVINPTNQTTVAGANQITVGESSNNPNFRLNMGFYYDGDGYWKGSIQSTHNGPALGKLILQPSGGQVGIGTSPIAQLHVYGLGTDYNSYTNGDATGATLYLQDSGNTSGNGGQILFGASLGGVAGVFASIKGGVNGNQPAGPAGDIIFCTRGTTGNVTEKMRITYSGLVGIITGQSVTHQLQIAADDAYKTMTSTWAYGSDARIKRNVRDLEGGLSIINRIRPIEAEFNGLGGSAEGQRTVSVIAQEIREVLPGTVSPHRAKLHPEDSEDTELLAFNPHEILFHLILAVKQLSGQLAALKGA
jgi:hypothetical protein